MMNQSIMNQSAMQMDEDDNNLEGTEMEVV